MTPRPAHPNDLSRVLELNENAVPHVNSIPMEDMSWFLERAPYFKVLERKNDGILGFLIALPPKLDYKSANYRWFSSRYQEFLYIDRIVVADEAHGQGLGKKLYRDLIETARASVPRLTCEVNSSPPNPRSMAFHENLGFFQVGTQKTEGGTKKVVLLSLDLK